MPVSNTPRRKRAGSEGDIDPARVDMQDRPKKRKRKEVLRKREPMPAHLVEHGEGAKRRMAARPATPGVMLEPDGDGSYYPVSPWADDERWFPLLADAFGTRSHAVVNVFMGHLKGLCGQSYDFDAERWKPSEMEWNAALAIVNSARPKNELQAMTVAQMVAIHWMQMRHTGYQLGRTSGWMEPKDAATTSMLARTFVQQLDGLRRMQAKPRTARQKITVHRETHIHNHEHKHVHLEGGAEQIGEQCHEPRTVEHESRPALLSPDKAADLMPMPRNEREEAVSNPRSKGRGSKG